MMEKKYQHMMEQVNMDEGFASGLLEQIQAERPQKRPQPLPDGSHRGLRVSGAGGDGGSGQQ